MSNTVLLVEDDAAMRKSITQSLTIEGFDVIEASSYEEAVFHISKRLDGVVLSDIRLPGKDGFDVLRRCRDIDPQLPVLLLTGGGDVPMALKSMRQGASEFLEKPIHPDKLTVTIKKWLLAREQTLKNRAMEEQLNETDAAAKAFPGSSHSSTKLREKIRELSAMPLNVHIQGQAGTGKTLAAQTIHDLSKKYGNIIFTDAIALQTDTLQAELKQVKVGTLLLRNIEHASIEQQMLIQSTIDNASKVRVVTTSSITLDDCRRSGMLESLYYTLNGVVMTMPNLQDRKEDILDLFQAYIVRYAKTFHRQPPPVTSQIRAALLARPWDGNLKELQAYAKNFTIGLDAEDQANTRMNLSEQVLAYERLLLVEALQVHNGSTQLAAEELDIPVATFYDKLRKHCLKSKAYRK